MKTLIDRQNFWLMFAMLMFAITKITALICAVIIAIRGNIWIGSALFVGALIVRITWTFIPDVEKTTQLKEELAALKAERAEMLALLKEIEWSGDTKGCPWCENHDIENEGLGHSDDCKLDAMIKKLEK